MPLSGTYRVSYSLTSVVYSGKSNNVYLHLNDDQLPETRHTTYSDRDQVQSTSGLVVTLEASAGDTIELRTSKMDHQFYRINFCVEYVYPDVYLIQNGN